MRTNFGKRAQGSFNRPCRDMLVSLPLEVFGMWLTGDCVAARVALLS